MNRLLMPFTDESESFTNGFECGQVWERIKEGECFDKQLIHRVNIEQIEKICETFAAQFDIEIVDAEWAYLTIKTRII